MNIIHIDAGHYSVPVVGRECLEMIWTEARACHRCPLKECYRNGWNTSQVSGDNARLVKETQARRFAIPPAGPEGQGEGTSCQ